MIIVDNTVRVVYRKPESSVQICVWGNVLKRAEEQCERSIIGKLVNSSVLEQFFHFCIQARWVDDRIKEPKFLNAKKLP